MTLLRISSQTSRQFDSLKARVARLQPVFVGATTTEQLARSEAELAAISAEAKALRMAVRGEIAAAGRREREDRQRRTA